MLKIGKYLRYTLEWRVIATAADFTIVYLFTGEVTKAINIAIVLILIKSTLFYFWRKYRQ